MLRKLFLLYAYAYEYSADACSRAECQAHLRDIYYRFFSRAWHQMHQVHTKSINQKSLQHTPRAIRYKERNRQIARVDTCFDSTSAANSRFGSAVSCESATQPRSPVRH